MTVPIPYLTTAAGPVNEAIDILGEPGQIIGSLSDGTPVAETARRYYGQGLRQLLRTCPWDFARARKSLTLLGDATGQSAAPVSAFVESPWTYAYGWPLDGVMGRWLPWSPINAQPTNSSGVPLTTGVSVGVPYPLVPGRFLVSSSDQYPIEAGTLPWTQLPDLQRTFGVGPISRKVILTDCANAEFVYTKFEPVIEIWDGLFRSAFVTMLALALVNVAIKDPKVRIAERDRLVPQLKNAIADARLANGQESGQPQSTDSTPDWIRARNQGPWGMLGGGGVCGGIGYLGQCGYYGGGYGDFSWFGSVY